MAKGSMPGMALTERRLVAVDGGSLEVLVGGAGSPALCEAPHPVVRGVAAPCAPLNGLGLVVQISPRGATGSTPRRVPRDATIAHLADDLEAVRVDLGLGPWVVVGHSAGGFVALEYARRHPASAAGLVLVATPPGPRPVYADAQSRNSALHPHWQAELAEYPPPAAPAGASAFRVVRLRDGLWMALEGDAPLTPLPVPGVSADLAARLERALAFDPCLGWARSAPRRSSSVGARTTSSRSSTARRCVRRCRTPSWSSSAGAATRR